MAIDVQLADQDQAFLPALTPLLQVRVDEGFRSSATALREELRATAAEGASLTGTPIHPLRVIHELQQVVTPATTLALDVGSHSIWMNRYFPAPHARHVLVSNGQQAQGVALPWAIACHLCRLGTPVISVSGDGGFLFTATELETARRLGCRFGHLLWNSRSSDMV
ncbi:MAG: thiamine pyrophosphate-dependent enzyme [Synechococcus sp.]|nr:thiamine pyrophosphate-dependent enzyme [Synechococcus sp.]